MKNDYSNLPKSYREIKHQRDLEIRRKVKTFLTIAQNIFFFLGSYVCLVTLGMMERPETEIVTRLLVALIQTIAGYTVFKIVLPEIVNVVENIKDILGRE